MAFVATGHSQTKSFFPNSLAVHDVYSPTVLGYLLNALTLDKTTTSQYRGTPSGVGSMVRIITTKPTEAREYTPGEVVPIPDRAEHGEVTLKLDKSYINDFRVDNLQVLQEFPSVSGVVDGISKMTKAQSQRFASEVQEILTDMKGNAETLAQKFETALYADMADAAAVPIGSMDAPKAPTTDQAFLAIAQILKTGLDRANTPKADRFLLVAPEAYGFLASDDRFVNHGSQTNGDVLKTGELGQLMGFTLITSNNLPFKVDGDNVISPIIAGWKNATGQLVQMLGHGELEISGPDGYIPDAKLIYDTIYGGWEFIRPEMLKTLWVATPNLELPDA